MSRQKLQVSAWEACSVPRAHRRRGSTHYEDAYDDERPERRRHRRREKDGSGTSINVKRHRHHRRHKSRPEPSLHPSDIITLKRKLRDIEQLKLKIEELQQAFSKNTVDSSKTTIGIEKYESKARGSSCFGFLSKKSKPEIVQLFGGGSKLSYEKQNKDGFGKPKDSRSSRRRDRLDLERKENDHNLARQHRITNNNTIVLPESYGVAQQQSGEQILMNSLSQKLEAQVGEIKEIKDTLNQCIGLLKRNGAADQTNCTGYQTQLILEDYIKLNRVLPSSYDNYIPNAYRDDKFLARRLEHRPPNIESFSWHSSKTSQGGAINPICNIYCDEVREGKGVVMKVSPMRKRDRSTKKTPVKSNVRNPTSCNCKEPPRKKGHRKLHKKRSVGFRKSGATIRSEYTVEPCKERGKASSFFKRLFKLFCCMCS